MCKKCGKAVTNSLQVAFDKFPGPLFSGKDFGLCSCPENDVAREAARK